MIRIVRHLLVAALLAMALAGCGSSAASDSPDTLTLAVIPYENAQSITETYQPLADLIGRETGRTVRIESVTDYAALVEGQRAGTIQIALHGSISYVLARDTGAGVEPIAVPVLQRSGPTGYRSYLVARADSGIRTLSDLRGRTVCFVDAGSTSGRLYPLAALQKAGLTEADYTPRYAGGHDASVLAVRDGDCDAGAVNDAMFDRTLPSQGEIDTSRFTKVWTSDPIVNSPLVLSDRLAPELREQIRRIVVEKANVDVLGGKDIAGFWGFKPISDKDFDPIREVCRTTRADVCGTG